MNKVTHLIPKLDPELERVLAHPFALREMIRYLESRGVVVQDGPQLSQLEPEDARNAIRLIMRELRFREMH